jgi:hypothetical protein
VASVSNPPRFPRLVSPTPESDAAWRMFATLVSAVGIVGALWLPGLWPALVVVPLGLVALVALDSALGDAIRSPIRPKAGITLPTLTMVLRDQAAITHILFRGLSPAGTFNSSGRPTKEVSRTGRPLKA